MYQYKISNDTQGVTITSKRTYKTKEEAKAEAKNTIGIYCTLHIEGFTINDKIKVEVLKNV